MNIYVMVDAEGLCGIYSSDQVNKDGDRYMQMRQYMTDEINVVARALKEAGVEKVYVKDAHSSGGNLIFEKLSEDVDICIMGNTNPHRFPDLEHCDGVILLGYHAMAGTKGAVLEHSMSSRRIQNYWINDKKAGEIAIDAGIIGDYGLPVIMVSGDNYACKEAEELLPWAVACEVKTSTSVQGIMSMPLQKAYEHVADCVKKAVKSIDKMQPLVYEKPIQFKVEVMERIQLPDTYSKPYMEIIDGRTYVVTAESMEEALYRHY